MNKNYLITHLLLSLLYCSSVSASENRQSFLLTSGLDYSSGYYGLKHKTDMLYIPLLLKYHQDNWDLSLTFSYIKMTGPSGVLGGGDGGVIPTGSKLLSVNSNLADSEPCNCNTDHGNKKPTITEITSNEGIGDILFKANYALDIPLQLPFLLELGGQLKIPLADEEKELGTGEFDWSIFLDLGYNLGSFSPFMTLGYKFMGDPDTLNLNNIYFSSLGLDYKILANLHTGLIYDYKQKVLSSSYDISESTLYLNWTINQKLSVNTYLVKGFSEASPDWASGLQFSFSF